MNDLKELCDAIAAGFPRTVAVMTEIINDPKTSTRDRIEAVRARRQTERLMRTERERPKRAEKLKRAAKPPEAPAAKRHARNCTCRACWPFGLNPAKYPCAVCAAKGRTYSPECDERYELGKDTPPPFAVRVYPTP